MSQGETEHEALENVFQVIRDVLETRMADELQAPDFEFAGTRVTRILKVPGT